MNDENYGVFSAIVISQPCKDDQDAGELPKIVVPRFEIVARDLAAATMEAGRKLPAKCDINKVKVIVRPF